MDYKKVVEKKRTKYGKNIFRTWGKMGGSEILKAYAEGRVTIRRKK